jgi:5,10-methylenetetrahydrofolate reductase
MKSFRNALEKGDFLITAECDPPKGTDVREMLENAAILKGKVHAVNVTDNQSSVMRMGSLGASKVILDAGLEPIYQLACRDRNRLAQQSDILSAHALGIRNVLCLTGDYVNAGDHPEAKPVFDIESVQMLRMVEKLNNGRDCATVHNGKPAPDGIELDGATNFLPGAVVAPEANPIEPQQMKFVKKVKAGARFFQTQAIYDLDKFKGFMEFGSKYDTKILAGILLLKSAGMARFLNNFVPGVNVPNHLIEELKAAEEPIKKGIEIAARQVKELKSVCHGVHVMAIKAEHLVPEILGEAGLL